MKNKFIRIFRIMALLTLVILLVPSILFLMGVYSLEKVHWIMLLATLGWFGSASAWMGWKNKNPEVTE